MKKKRTVWQWFVRVIAGYEITVISLILLILVVLFSTLEQAEVGLYTVSKRYYDMDVLFVRPELRGNALPFVLPGAYWTCAIFTVNLIAGGIVRMSTMFTKGNPDGKQIIKRVLNRGGVLVSHMSMAVLMIAGAVDYHASKMTMLGVKEGSVGNIGSESNDIVIEVGEIEANRFQNIHEVQNQQIGDMVITGEKSIFDSSPDLRVFRFPDFPFSLEFRGWYKNATIHEKASERREGDGPFVNGTFIKPHKILTESELERLQSFNRSQPFEKRVADYNHAACYARVVPDDGSAAQDIILWFSLSHPVSVTVSGKTYGFKLTSHKTILPFVVGLKELEVDKYQGSSMARTYKSSVVYDSNSIDEMDSVIEMNEPLRADGYTLYQASWVAAMDEEGREAMLKAHALKEKEEGKRLDISWEPKYQRQSVYQVVSNPADKWPEYCIYVCGIALLFHFGVKLVMYIINSFNRT